MSDPKIVPDVPEEQPRAMAEIRITLWPGGKIHVDGPIQDKILFYGLLEIARERVSEYHRQAANSHILPVRSV